MKTLWFIDDEQEILELYGLIVESINLEKRFCLSWNECEPKHGDIVIHDVNGVGIKKEVKGVIYLSVSGDFKINADIAKPFEFGNMTEKIERLTKDSND